MSTRSAFETLVESIPGLGGRSDDRTIVTGRGLFNITTFLFILVLVGGPLVFYVWGSFWSTSPGLGGHFTLSGYEQLQNPNVYQTVWNTVMIAILGTLVALALGILGMFVTIKTNARGGHVITLLFIFQYLVPSYIAALAWNFWAGRSSALNELLMWAFGLDAPPIDIYSVWGIALVGGAHYAGLVFLLSSGAVRSVPSSLEETSQLCGAPTWKTFTNITLRLSIPSIGIAIVLIFSRLIQSFGIPIILGVPGQVYVVATHMYFSLNGNPPNFAFASALGMIILVISLAGLGIQRWLTGQREKYETVGGQGGGIGTLKFELKRPWLLMVPFTVVLVGVYVMPFLALLFSSFQGNYAGLNVFEAKWTIDNYVGLFSGSRWPQVSRALVNSFVVAGVGAFLGMVVSSFASYIIVKSNSSLRDVLDFLSLAPAAMPGIIVATAFLWIFVTYRFMGLYGTIWVIMLALTARFIVYGVRATNSSFRSIGPELEEVARISGGGFFSIFKDIYIPLIKPGFTAGYILLFVDYIKVLTIPLLLQGTESQLISVVIWELSALGIDQEGAAMAMVLLLIIAVIYFLATKFTKRGVTEI